MWAEAINISLYEAKTAQVGSLDHVGTEKMPGKYAGRKSAQLYSLEVTGEY